MPIPIASVPYSRRFIPAVFLLIYYEGDEALDMYALNEAAELQWVVTGQTRQLFPLLLLVKKIKRKHT